MKILDEYVDVLLKELKDLQESWLEDEEIENVYSKKLIAALQQYKKLQGNSIIHFPSVEPIFEEIAQVKLPSELTCFISIQKFYNSYLMGIYDAFKFYHLNFSELLHHAQTDILVKIFSIFIRFNAFTPEQAVMAMRKKNIVVFCDLFNFLNNANGFHLVRYFMHIHDIESLEAITLIFKHYEVLKLIGSQQMKADIIAVASHIRPTQLLQAIKNLPPQMPDRAKNVLLLIHSPNPAQLAKALYYLDSFKLRTQVLETELIKQEYPNMLAELYKFIVDNKLAKDSILPLLCEDEIKFLYKEYYQKVSLPLATKQDRLKLYFSFCCYPKKDQTNLIVLMVYLIQIKKQFQPQLEQPEVMEKMIESFRQIISQNLLKNNPHGANDKAIQCLSRITEKAFEYSDRSIEINIKELLTMLYFTFIVSEKPEAFICILIEALNNIDSCSSSGEAFLHLAMVLQSCQKLPIKYLSEILIENTERNIKAYFFKNIQQGNKEKCLNLLLALQGNYIPDDIWQDVQPMIYQDLSQSFPHEKKIDQIVNLGRRVIAPVRELVIAFNKHFEQQVSRESMFRGALVENGFALEPKGPKKE